MADWKNKLYFGDNLDILREQVPDESVDLIYLDPPFNSNATYNVLFRGDERREVCGADSKRSATRGTGTLDPSAPIAEVVTDGPKKLADLLQAMRSFLGQNDMMAYLTMMAQRMVELHRVPQTDGQHLPPLRPHGQPLPETAVMDAVFRAAT